MMRTCFRCRHGLCPMMMPRRWSRHSSIRTSKAAVTAGESRRSLRLLSLDSMGDGEANESRESVKYRESTDSIDPKASIDPKDSTDPTDPTDSIDSIDSLDSPDSLDS